MKTTQSFIEGRSQEPGGEDGSSTPDAITYIRGSSICADAKHKWLLPLIEKVLDDDLDKDSIAAFVLGDEAKKVVLPKKTGRISKSVSFSTAAQLDFAHFR